MICGGEQFGVGDGLVAELQGGMVRASSGGLTEDVRQRFFAKEFGAGGAVQNHL